MLLGTFTTALFATGVITLEQHKSLFVLCFGVLLIILIDLACEFYKLTNETRTSGVTAVATNAIGTTTTDYTVTITAASATVAPTITPTSGVAIDIEEGSSYSDPAWTTEVNSPDSHSTDGGGE